MLSSVVVSQELTRLLSSPVHWRHLCVLVVDDHSTYRAMMGLQLQKLGIAHELVEDGRSALAAIARKHFDLVISDCQMPVLDGCAMARAIRLQERSLGLERVSIIALTGNIGPDDPQCCRDAGMDAWFLKPLTLDQLHEVLMRWLPGKQLSPPIHRLEQPAIAWPNRASLIKTFGNAQVVNLMIDSLLFEAREDCAALAHARMTLNARLTAERLHRLVGSLAFLGVADLESRGSVLIEEVRTQGVIPNLSRLEAFQHDLAVCLTYMSTL